MLSKSRCPHTGVVNYFTDADPLLAVGSVAKANTSEGYAWRCYVGEEAGGLAPDLARAEARLTQAIARGTRIGQAPRSLRMEPAPSRASRYWQGLNEVTRR
jgi:hypothetical protein